MVTAVDTSVLLDVLLDDPSHFNSSMAALQKAAREGRLVISEAVLAELVPALQPGEVEEFPTDLGLDFVPSSQPVAILAGEMYRTHRLRGGKRTRVIADFLIAAHAQLLADRLLARDRGYYRDYFSRLPLWDPLQS